MNILLTGSDGFIGSNLFYQLKEEHNVIGFDIDKKRVRELNEGIDRTKETVIKKNFSKNIYFTNNIKKLQLTNISDFAGISFFE